MAAAATQLCDMPEEVIHTIVTKLGDDMRAVLRLAQTSRWFASHAAHPERWRKLLQDHWGAAAVERFGQAADCPLTCFARTQLVPAGLPNAQFDTAWEPERFVPAPFSECRLLVEIIHEGRVVLQQAVQPDSGMWSMDFDLIKRDFPATGGTPVSRTTGILWPPSAPQRSSCGRRR
jgi:hypothetical protein